jgi:hypothetical protein
VGPGGLQLIKELVQVGVVPVHSMRSVSGCPKESLRSRHWCRFLQTVMFTSVCASHYSAIRN